MGGGAGARWCGGRGRSPPRVRPWNVPGFRSSGTNRLLLMPMLMLMLIMIMMLLMLMLMLMLLLMMVILLILLLILLPLLVVPSVRGVRACRLGARRRRLAQRRMRSPWRRAVPTTQPTPRGRTPRKRAQGSLLSVWRWPAVTALAAPRAETLMTSSTLMTSCRTRYSGGCAKSPRGCSTTAPHTTRRPSPGALPQEAALSVAAACAARGRAGGGGRGTRRSGRTA